MAKSKGTRGRSDKQSGAEKRPILAALALIRESPERPWNLRTLAAKVGMARTSFVRRFIETIGETPSRYLMRWRVELAAKLLRVPGASVSLTAQRVGYDSEVSFSRAFRRHLGVWPKPLRRQKKRSPTRRTAVRRDDPRRPLKSPESRGRVARER